MQSYTKVYLKYFGYDESDWIQCECCGGHATEIHHIIARSKEKSLLNDILNLMALCRRCHQKYGDLEQYMEFLIEKHKDFMDSFNNEFKKITE